MQILNFSQRDGLHHSIAYCPNRVRDDVAECWTCSHQADRLSMATHWETKLAQIKWRKI